MTFKKESILNRFLIELILLISRFLNFLDFRLRTLFVLFNVVLCSVFLMVYVKPILDTENYLNLSQDTRILLSKEEKKENPKVIVTETMPSFTLPVINIVINTLPGNLSAKSILVYDLKNKMQIYEKDKELTLPPASLVKMVSIMYFFEKIKMEEKYLTISECNFVEGQKVGYKKSEKVSGKDMIYSSLVFSGGDSICNLYKITDSNIPDFNEYAKKLGMKNSNFTNFIGLDYPGNYTTSEDLLNMTLEFIKNDKFNEIVSLKSYQMGNGKVLYNTNKMLFEGNNSVGIKTGTTVGAKENLIYRHKDIKKDLDIIIIILNSNSRYQDTKLILNSIKNL